MPYLPRLTQDEYDILVGLVSAYRIAVLADLARANLPDVARMKCASDLCITDSLAAKLKEAA